MGRKFNSMDHLEAKGFEERGLCATVMCQRTIQGLASPNVLLTSPRPSASHPCSFPIFLYFRGRSDEEDEGRSLLQHPKTPPARFKTRHREMESTIMGPPLGSGMRLTWAPGNCPPFRSFLSSLFPQLRLPRERGLRHDALGVLGTVSCERGTGRQ